METFHLALVLLDILEIHQIVIQNASLIRIVPVTWLVLKKNVVIHVLVHAVYMLTALYSIMSLCVPVLMVILEMPFPIVTPFLLVNIRFPSYNMIFLHRILEFFHFLQPQNHQLKLIRAIPIHVVQMQNARMEFAAAYLSIKVTRILVADLNVLRTKSVPKIKPA